MSIFLAYFVRYEIILPKVLQIKSFLFLRKLNDVILSLVKFQLHNISANKKILRTEFCFSFPVEYFLPRMLRTLSLYFFGLIQA